MTKRFLRASIDALQGMSEEAKAYVRVQFAKRDEPRYVAQTNRSWALIEAATSTLNSIWLAASRAPAITKHFLTFHFLDDTIQSVSAIGHLSKDGLYNPARREMRFLLESTCKHLYVDLTRMGTTFNDKLSFLDSSVPRSSMSFVSQIDILGFDLALNKEFTDDVKSTYARLCRYVHRSTHQIRESMRLSEKGQAFHFGTAPQFESINREITRLYDLVIAMHLTALGPSLTGDLFVHALDEMGSWPFHRTKYVARISGQYDYKLERTRR
jgi:hypothetical protein